MLFDPAGTSGGLGLFGEFRVIWNFEDRHLDEFYSLIGENTTATSGWDYVSFSLGIVIPIALRVK